MPSEPSFERTQFRRRLTTVGQHVQRAGGERQDEGPQWRVARQAKHADSQGEAAGEEIHDRDCRAHDCSTEEGAAEAGGCAETRHAV
ncbi:MAG: hypothetical protein LC753_17015 [Acidobacteria bacterium]|nr:hypothetical protein [Acidobacteriota bacterium]